MILTPPQKKITEVLSPLNCFIVFFYNTDNLDVYVYYTCSVLEQNYPLTHISNGSNFSIIRCVMTLKSM